MGEIFFSLPQMYFLSEKERDHTSIHQVNYPNA